MAIDLTDINELKEASATAIARHRSAHNLDGWLQRLETWLQRVATVDHQTFVSADFQRELWDGETITATGQGHVDVAPVIAQPAIAEKLWQLRQIQLPADPGKRHAWFGTAWDEVAALVWPLTGRNPRLKQYRVFASLWPQHFTTIAYYRELRSLARAMGLSSGTDHRTLLHHMVLEQLDKAGVVTASPEERMALPWVLLVHFVHESGSDATELPSETPSELKLNPLPADRRRRGMLSINGALPSVRAMIEFAKDGCKRADMLEHIRSVNPKLATNSLATNLNALIAEWGVMRASGDDVHLTDRGAAFLENGEPEEVSDWLLTRILGFDNLLYLLREGPLQQKDVISHLQQVNPGWTSGFLPTSLMNWVKNMELAELGPGNMLRLTERGQAWAARIEWTPGKLAPAISKPVAVPKPAATSNASHPWPQLPALDTIRAAFRTDLAFHPALVAQLHAGLWNRRHPRRHFAVLTGLSGAGKTQLALSYAKGLWANEPVHDGFHMVTVQPGWHDPSSLLGYVNPLNNNAYVRTGFLDFLLRAEDDPDRPYVVLLDEMNLSHPEQYLAPLLSAMESGEDIELHSLGDEVGDVPGTIGYPANLVIIGTVNMDETTHGLSDKVLDRATVIEFWDIQVDAYPGWKRSTLDAADLGRVRDALNALMIALRPVRLHFGWRTIGDVLGYVEAAREGGELVVVDALDHAIYARILPKLRGEDTQRLRAAFAAVASVLASHGLGRSSVKAAELLADLQELGSARFWR